MKLREIISREKVPCAKCPYKLGTVKTPINPCPECRMTGYSSYEWFLKERLGETRKKCADKFQARKE